MSQATPARPSPGRWILGGAVSGAIGAMLFGLVLMIVAPGVIAEDIPAFYGSGPSATVGWMLHVIHGAGLGIIFALVVTRALVFETLMGPTETAAIAGLSGHTRLALAGLVYGIAIWALLPFVGLSLLGAVGLFTDPGFGGVAAEMFIGHVLFGLLVGTLFGPFVQGAASSPGEPRGPEAATE